MGTDTNDRSLDELLKIAQRAQDMIGHMDLHKIQQHDQGEVAKLKQVVESIEALERGEEVSFVPGIDDPEEAEAPLELDPDQVRKAKILSLLDDVGYSGRLGRIFATHSEFPVKPIEFVPHQEGLPKFDMVVAPDYSPADGVHGVFVSVQGVFSAMVGEPIANNRWRILRSTPYDTNEQMIELVRHYATQPKRGVTEKASK